jgi:hypothetical protein
MGRKEEVHANSMHTSETVSLLYYANKRKRKVLQL